VNIVEQRVTPTEVYVRCSNGASVTLTKVEVQDFYRTTNGNAASRRTQTIAWAKQQIVDAVGADMLDALLLDLDVDDQLDIRGFGSRAG
jgi:hypothetical protein